MKSPQACLRMVAVVTTGRSDYGLLVPLLRAIEADPNLDLRLWVTGAHFSRQFGSTVEEIAGDRFCIAEKIEMLLASDQDYRARQLDRRHTFLASHFANRGYAAKHIVDLLERFPIQQSACSASPVPGAILAVDR